MRAVERETERVVGGERRQDVLGHVPLRERQRELDALAADVEHPPSSCRPIVVRSKVSHDEIVAREERLEPARVGGHDGDTACGQSLDRLGVRAGGVLDRPDELEVLRPESAHDGHVRARDLAELRDLPETAHAELGDEHPGVGLQAENGERQAELVVLARVGVDGRRDRSAQRAERVLRRRLPRRADDRDDTGVAALAHQPRERRERLVLVVRNQRCGAALRAPRRRTRHRCSVRRTGHPGARHGSRRGRA